MRASELVRIITSTIVDGFQNDLTQLFSITCRHAIWNICSGRPKVKVTLEGQIFVRTITPTSLDGFQFQFAQLSLSWIDVPFEAFVQVGPRSRSHLKIKHKSRHRAQHVVPGQLTTWNFAHILFIYWSFARCNFEVSTPTGWQIISPWTYIFFFFFEIACFCQSTGGGINSHSVTALVSLVKLHIILFMAQSSSGFIWL